MLSKNGISQLMKKKIGPAPRIGSLEGEIMNFTMGQNLKQLKLTLWAKKSINIVLEYTKRCGKATLGPHSGALAPDVHSIRNNANDTRLVFDVRRP